MDASERSILTVTCFGHFMSHFNMMFFPALVLPLTRHFELDPSLVVPLSFWMYLLYGVSALPWGMLGDRLGPKRLLYAMYLGGGICGAGAGLALGSPLALSLLLGGLGLFSGIYHPAGLGLISRGMSRMSMALGYNGIAGNAGLAAAPVAAGLLNYFFGTQTAFIILGGLNLAGSLVMLLLPLKDPEQGPREESSADRARHMALGFGLLCACMVLVGLVYRGSTVVLPYYFELRSEALFRQLELLQGWVLSRNVAATALTSLVYVVGMAGQYAGGRIAERFDPRQGYLVFHSLAVPLVLMMGYAWDLPLVLLSGLFFFFILGMQPIENTLVANLTPDRLRHSAFGVKFVLNFGVGAFAVHLVGIVERTWDLLAVFWSLTAAAAGIASLAALLLLATRNLRF
jgi:MFS family permease